MTSSRLPFLTAFPCTLRRPWTLAALAWIAWSTPTRGQPQTPDTVALAPIAVSVLRSPMRLDRLPFSASVLAGSDLAAGASGLFLREALHALPGVRVQNRYNPAVGERMSIRGFGARAQFGVRGIKVLVDGMPATLPDGQTTLDHLDLGSLDRVEVLRGPAAALHGNGAGGVVAFESAAPFADGHLQRLTAVAGSHGLFRLQATGSGTAGRVGYRASVARSAYDGFRDNASGSGEDPYSRADRTTASASVDFPLGGGRASARFSGLELDALNAGSLPAELFDEGSDQAWGFNVARRTRKSVQQAQAGLRWTGDLGGLEGAFSTYALTRRLDNPIPTSVIDLGRRGLGARLVLARAWDGRAGENRLDVGVEGEVQSDDRRNFANESGEAGATTLDQRERVRAAALFSQLRLSLAPRVGVVGALRLDRFEFRATDRLIAAANPDDSGSRAMGALSPSLGLHVDLGRHGLFASVARSFETPTTTELANRPTGAGGFNPDLEPQRGWTVEGGLRGRLGRRTTYDVVGFASRIVDQLTPFEVPGAPGRRFYRNAGRSRIRGLEVSAHATASPLSGRAAYSYVDARFAEFAVAGRDHAGARVPGVAPHRFEASVRAERRGWFGELRVEARGAVPADDANEASAPAHTLLDARFGAPDVSAGRFRMAPFAAVTNVANVRHAASVVVNAFGGRFFEPGPGRGGHVGLDVSWRGSRR